MANQKLDSLINELNVINYKKMISNTSYLNMNKFLNNFDDNKLEKNLEEIISL